MGYNDKECRGCLTHNDRLCAILPNCECPCLTCLIKGMCRDDCEEVRSYVKKASSYKYTTYGEGV